jgi:hypothetical protein
VAKEFKYNYVICTRADYDTYRKQCAALEKHVPDLVKEKELHDVDDSRYQHYWYGDQEIRVCNSTYLDELFVESDIELQQFFNSEEPPL